MAYARLDAEALREVMSRFGQALRAHREELDSLNVYPIPDGDTGTNMSLTQEAVEQALAGMDGATMREVGDVIARASLMGARGNSGVILSQVLRGLCESLCRTDDPGPGALADALQTAAEQAYRAVAHPVEGTVLTVASGAARAAVQAADGGADLPAVAEAALEAARESVARTRDMLPELRAAGVVDAGGKGLLLLFDALWSAIAANPMTEQVGPLGPIGHVEEDLGPAVVEFKYEVQYLLEGEEDRVPSLRERLSRLGDSVVVVGGGGTFKVHVHTNEPGTAVEEGLDVGSPRDILITDLESDVARHCLAGQARAVQMVEQRVALVAVAEGEGLTAIFRSLGAVVVPGGPGRNPSVGELLEAIEAAPADAVIVLPNHENIVPAAERAASESRKPTEVIRTTSIPQGVAAAAAFHPLEELDSNTLSVLAAVDETAAGALARATRDADTPAGGVREGDWLGIDGRTGRALATGPDPAAVAVDLARRLRLPAHEVLTLFVGAAPSGQEAEAMEAALREALPDLEVEVHRGGQPHHDYLIGLE